MIEIVFTAIILALVLLIGYMQYLSYKHIGSLEDKLVKTNPQVYWRERNETATPVPNEMSEGDEDEIPLSQIPMMEFEDRNFNIQMEGDPETPQEARARGK